MALVQPYASRHEHLDGPGDARPTALEIVHDQGLIGALHGCTMLVTGCTSGIGIETARALYATSANLYITARDMAKGTALAQELSTESDRQIGVIEMSLDSFDSIRAAAGRFLAREAQLNVLVNNAGIMACPESQTVDGHELQFGTNHLGHFLLFQLLKPALLAGATLDRPSRVISVASSGHRFCTDIAFDDLELFKTDYQPYTAYGRSKLANIHFANELDRRYGSKGIHANSLHPGSIKTPLQKYVKASEQYEQAIADPAYMKQVKSAEQGAATSVWAAVGDEWKHRGGRYLENVAEAGPVAEGGPLFRPGYAVQAYRPEDEKKLWTVSNHLCGTTDE